MTFWTGMRLSCELNLPKMKWISTDLLDIGFNVQVCLELNAGMDFISVIFTEMNFIPDDKISCKPYLKWNVHQNIGALCNAAKMKLHVNRTCFHAGLKCQTGTSSFYLSCKHTFGVTPCSCFIEWKLMHWAAKAKSM